MSADASVTLEVPSGPSRLIQIVGIIDPTGVYCDSKQPIGEVDDQGSGAEIYEVGRRLIDLFSDVSVDIPNLYDPAAPRRVNCGSGVPVSLSSQRHIEE